jgi:hypothetical protein
MNLFPFSSRQNGLRTRNKHLFLFSIDNLNNLAPKNSNKKLCKNDMEQTHFLPSFNTVKPQIGWKWVNKEKKECTIGNY